MVFHLSTRCLSQRVYPTDADKNTTLLRQHGWHAG